MCSRWLTAAYIKLCVCVCVFTFATLFFKIISENYVYCIQVKLQFFYRKNIKHKFMEREESQIGSQGVGLKIVARTFFVLFDCWFVVCAVDLSSS